MVEYVVCVSMFRGKADSRMVRLERVDEDGNSGF